MIAYKYENIYADSMIGYEPPSIYLTYDYYRNYKKNTFTYKKKKKLFSNLFILKGLTYRNYFFVKIKDQKCFSRLTLDFYRQRLQHSLILKIVY